MTAGGGATRPRQWFADRPIAAKLAIGLGLLGLLTSIAIVVGLVASARATANIDLTTERRAPITLASTRAQADMLRMVGEVRGYLALGDQTLRDGYRAASEAFEADFAELEGTGDRIRRRLGSVDRATAAEPPHAQGRL